MPHHDGLPLVFQFPEEDTQPESQEHKALWDELELALREDTAPVPAAVAAPVAPTAPAPIPMALMGWEPHIVTELEATGFHEVLTDFHAPMHLPEHALARALTRTLWHPAQSNRFTMHYQPRDHLFWQHTTSLY